MRLVTKLKSYIVTMLVAVASANAQITISPTIANNSVTNAQTAQMPANTVKGNNTGSTANAADLTITQALAVLAGTGAYFPITVSVKNVTILTAGTPADIATIALPSWCTRYRTISTSISGVTTNFIFAETASGTLAGATCTAWDTAGGAGTQIQGGAILPAAAGTGVQWYAQSLISTFTSSTIYIRQTANSANAGTCSFYITIFPIP